MFIHAEPLANPDIRVRTDLVVRPPASAIEADDHGDPLEIRTVTAWRESGMVAPASRA